MIWIIGNKGMLGRDLEKSFRKCGLDYIGSDVELDILRPEELSRFGRLHHPTHIVNCAAYTAVDKAEEDARRAYQINAEGVRNIAEVSCEIGAKLIHISTDYIFNGESEKPLTEDAPAEPLNVYGASKLQGEMNLIQEMKQYFIIRTAWLYGEYGSNFVHTMLKLMKEQDQINVIDDQIGSPSWTVELSELIITIIQSDSEQYGVYNYSGEGSTSWFGFASSIYKLGQSSGLIKGNCRIIPCDSESFITKAKRPTYSLLKKDKIRNTFNFDPSTWEQSLGLYIEELKINEIN